jgi:hypothetical protein
MKCEVTKNECREKSEMRGSNFRFCVVHTATAFVFALCGTGLAASGPNETPQMRTDPVAKPDGKRDAAFHFAEAKRLYVRAPGEIGYNKLSELERLWPSELTDRQRSLLTEWVAENSDALTQLRLGVQMAQDGNPFKDDIDLPTTPEEGPDLLPELARMTAFRAKLAATERGLTAEAQEDLLMCYRLGCELAQSASLVEYQIGIALQGLAADVVYDTLSRMSVDTTTMLRLQTCIQQATAAGDGSLANIIRGQRLCFIPPLRRSFEGTDPQSKLKHDEAVLYAVELDLTWEEMDALDLRYGRTIWDSAAGYAYCRLFLSLSPLERRARRLDFWKDLARLTHENPLVNLVMFNGPRLARARANYSAHQDALVATLALLRYRAEKGRFPDTLQELVSAGFASRLPMDPYSGKPQVYRRMDTDFILYSWGEDFDDDGGRHFDWGQHKEGGDHVFWPVQLLTPKQ